MMQLHFDETKVLIYARDFAGEAFPVRDDPKLATGEACVLCQQPLEDDAASRMAKFDEYISGRTANDSQKATNDYEVLVASINALRLGTAEQTKALLGVYGGLSDDHQAFIDEIALSELSGKTSFDEYAVNPGAELITDLFLGTD